MGQEKSFMQKDEEKIRNWQEGFCQKHIRKGGEKTAQELQTMAGNKSQIGYMNVPAKNNGEILSQMKEEFQRLGINYHVMEDMRTGDGLLQIMYLKKDEVAVRNWYSNYATDQLLRGGRQEYKDLMNLTNGKHSLLISRSARIKWKKCWRILTTCISIIVSCQILKSMIRES